MARGYNASADVLRTLADGADIHQIWDEFNDALDIAKSQRTALVNLFTFGTTVKGESVLQMPGGASDFEEASEYGVPRACASRPTPCRWASISAGTTSARRPPGGRWPT